MINVQIDRAFSQKELEEAVVEAVNKTLELQQKDISEIDLAIVITGDDQVRRLNRQYRGMNSPTDVLSFPNGELDPDTNHRNLGDIIISFPQAERQALARKGSDTSEIQLLVVHGVLHLLGYDHADETQKHNMWSRQLEVLKSLKLDMINPA